MIDWIDLLILILASFRLTHLIVFDDVTNFIRRPFLETVETTNDQGETYIDTKPKGTGLRKFIGSLIRCYWCTSVWSSILLVTSYLYFPIIPVLLILAVAGAASIVEAKLYSSD